MKQTTLFAALAAIFAPLTEAVTYPLQQFTNFGPNPTNVTFKAYIPSNLTDSPSVIVALHHCTSSGEDYSTFTKYAALSAANNFIVIYPTSPATCFDVHTNETLTHDAGGDSLGIASMVRYAIDNLNVDPKKVFATGTSLGGMMVEGADFWSNACANGTLVKTAQAWGDQVLAGYPEFQGTRPRLQVWHGTGDHTLLPINLAEANKQWSNVFEISFTRNNTNTPLPGYTQMVFGDGTEYVAYSAEGVGHAVPMREGDVLAWFGITGNEGLKPSIHDSTILYRSSPIIVTSIALFVIELSSSAIYKRGRVDVAIRY
ncbi:hypothetical protein G7Y89_g5551 [Cudoniella acicularis]|uniref:Carboxylic ester hydrolase n=1 Tax=Cudoniella acicularis TaxID=354080 RepID=A0A8H4W3W0_9HELO|nr:hypothetical protein G7Y89_g5551 [Cudoniella acicularis]